MAANVANDLLKSFKATIELLLGGPVSNNIATEGSVILSLSTHKIVDYCRGLAN